MDKPDDNQVDEEEGMHHLLSTVCKVVFYIFMIHGKILRRELLFLF